MATERIDVVVTDGVETSIAAKFDAIAKAAKAAYEATTKAAQAQAQTASAATALERAARAAAAAATQQEKLNTASAATALQQQRLATEVERTNAALQRSSVEITNAATAEQKLLAASASASAAQQKLAEASARAATAQAQTAAATAQVAAAQAQATAAATRAQTAQIQAAAAAQRLQQAQQAAATATTNTAAAQQRLAQAQADAARATTNSATAAVNNASAQQKLAKATSDAEAATARAELAQLRLQNAQNRTASSGGGLISTLQRFAVQMFALEKAVAAVQDGFKKVEEFQLFQNGLRRISESEADVTRLTGELLTVANKARSPLEAVGTLFQRIDGAIKQAGGSEQEAIAITQALSAAVATGNLSTAEQASALRQVSQAFNKGKLNGDEFVSVMENFPQFADAMAKSLNFANRGLLFSAAHDGLITLDTLRKGALELGKTVENDLAKSTLTASQAQTQLANSATIVIGELDKQLGITKSLTKGTVELANLLTQIANIQTNNQAGRVQDLKLTLARNEEDIKGATKTRDFLNGHIGSQTDLNRLLEQRETILANIRTAEKASADQARAAAERAPKQTVQDVRRLENKLDGDGLTAKQLAAQEKLDKQKKREEERAARAAARPVEAIDREIERLLKKADTLEHVSEVEKAQAEIEDGIYDKATPKQIQQLLILARRRDADLNAIAARKAFAAENKRVNDESDRETKQLDERTIAITAETQKLREQSQTMFATQAAIIALDTAKQTSILQAKLSAAQTAQETEAINSQIAAIRAQGEAKTQLANKQTFANNAGLQTGLPQDIFKGTEEAQAMQLKAFQSMKDQIDQLEADQLLTHEEAERAKTRISIEQEQARLANTQNFFGTLAGLSQSGNKRLQNIGKAAAVAQATIDGILAVQKALAAPPGWPFNAPNVIAVGIAQAANVSRLAGFESGGHTGYGGRSEIAGVVHGQEFVMNAEATAKNRNVLEAMNDGDTLQGSQRMKLIVNNYGTPQTYQVESISREEIRVIARDVVHKETPDVVASDMASPNSRTSKSLKQNFEVSPRRN
jgi:tape measure domain-containing protein